MSRNPLIGSEYTVGRGPLGPDSGEQAGNARSATPHKQGTRPRILFLSNYAPGHVISDRARYFAEALNPFADARLEYRDRGRLETMRRNLAVIREYGPSLVYTLDGLATEMAALLAHRMYGTPYIVDCADTRWDHLKVAGASETKARLFDRVDRSILGNAALVACRGVIQRIVFQSRYYNSRVVHLSEGADLSRWVPKAGTDLRRKYGLEGTLVVGVIGSIVWSEQFQWAYGREIVEALRILRDKPVTGVILPSLTSDPESLRRLEMLARDYGVEARLRIIPDIPRAQVPDYLAAMDVCVSTQLPTLIGEMRTTAKIPDYLACGKFVLATRVGDARFYLPEEMLLDYEDADQYYRDFASRVEHICDNPHLLDLGKKGLEVARTHFDYRRIAEEAAEIIRQVLVGNRAGALSPA